jgi:hypothetical protein
MKLFMEKPWCPRQHKYAIAHFVSKYIEEERVAMNECIEPKKISIILQGLFLICCFGVLIRAFTNVETNTIHILVFFLFT